MSFEGGERRADLGADSAVAADRRRPGRAKEVSPQLLPLMRGQYDLDAPADPAISRPNRPEAIQYVLGTAVLMSLLLIGAALRFMV